MQNGTNSQKRKESDEQQLSKEENKVTYVHSPTPPRLLNHERKSDSTSKEI
jgi:hypothetical protein